MFSRLAAAYNLIVLTRWTQLISSWREKMWLEIRYPSQSFSRRCWSRSGKCLWDEQSLWVQLLLSAMALGDMQVGYYQFNLVVAYVAHWKTFHSVFSRDFGSVKGQFSCKHFRTYVWNYILDHYSQAKITPMKSVKRWKKPPTDFFS